MADLPLRRTFIASLAAPLLGARTTRKARPKTMRMEATAHSEEGRTASGTRSRKGTVAADPSVLPLGSRIRINGAGRYSGEYTVEDTGRAIKGREIDIYMATGAEAKQFGRRTVKVTVLRSGNAE